MPANLPQLVHRFLHSGYNAIEFVVSCQLVNREINNLFHEETKQNRRSEVRRISKKMVKQNAVAMADKSSHYTEKLDKL